MTFNNIIITNQSKIMYYGLIRYQMYADTLYYDSIEFKVEYFSTNIDRLKIKIKEKIKRYFYSAKKNDGGGKNYMIFRTKDRNAKQYSFEEIRLAFECLNMSFNENGIYLQGNGDINKVVQEIPVANMLYKLHQDISRMWNMSKACLKEEIVKNNYPIKTTKRSKSGIWKDIVKYKRENTISANSVDSEHILFF